MRAGWLWFLIACSGDDPPARALQPRDEPPRAITREARCGNVRAVWRGVRSDGFDDFETLTIEAPGARPWRTTFEAGPPDSFDIFSPDCKHVLLLQAHLGPFHTVRLERFAEYAAGGKPDYVLLAPQQPTGDVGSGPHREGRWVTSTKVSYEWGCCSPPETAVFELAGK